MDKDLVLTIVDNYDYPFLEPFLASLKKTNFGGDLIIFVSDNVSKNTQKKIKFTATSIIHFESDNPSGEVYRQEFKEITPNISINNYRFLFFLGFLKEHENQYKRVMITDIRDVIFQKMPFENIEDGKIYFFLEDNKQTFANSQLNAKWFDDAFGSNSSISVNDNVISCAGVTIGSVQLVIEYLKYIQDNFKQKQVLNWGIDQGIHNGFVYQQKKDKDKYIISSNLDAIVATLGACSTYQQDKYGLIVNSSGAIYNIIHQYDRHENLFLAIKKKYVGSRIYQLMKRTFYRILP